MTVEGKPYRAKPVVLKSSEARILPPASTQQVSVPPSGPAPTKSTQLDLESTNLAATPQIAEGKMEDEAVELSDTAAATPTNNSRPNGDDVDARMAKIEEILDHAAIHVIEKCALIAEWVRHAEANAVSVFGQPDHKPQGGRPEGGIARAARALPVPGKTTEARRKFVERAIDIDGIWPEVKVAVRTAGLDDIQSALLAIADEKSLEAQLVKVKQLADRKGQPRRKKKSAASEPAAAAETNAGPTGASDSGSSIKSEIDEPNPVSKSELVQGKPASYAALVEFAKFMLAHITQGEQIALMLTASEDVKQFNRLANRVRLVIGRELGPDNFDRNHEFNRDPAREPSGC
jgi:hypothetical protein